MSRSGATGRRVFACGAFAFRDGGQFDAVATAAVFLALSATGRFDEGAAHGLGGSSEEVAAAVELLVPRAADTPRGRGRWRRACDPEDTAAIWAASVRSSS
jgi:hypothetical protein